MTKYYLITMPCNKTPNECGELCPEYYKGCTLMPVKKAKEVKEVHCDIYGKVRNVNEPCIRAVHLFAEIIGEEK